MDTKKLLKLSISFFSILTISLLLLSGCGSDNSVTNTAKGTVNGTILDYYGNPVQGIKILCSGQNPVSGPAGTFTVTNVTVPYDLSIADTTNAAGIVYRGLTTLSPILYQFSSSMIHNECTLDVSLPSMSANQKAIVVFTDSQRVQQGSTITAPNLLTSYTPDWYFPSASITGKVIILVFTLNGTQVVSYDKYGEKSGVVLSNGGHVTVAFQPGELTLNPSESVISGTITVPAGYEAPNNSLIIRFTSLGGLSRYSTLAYTTSTASFNFNAPTGLSSMCKLFIIASSQGPVGQHSTKLVEVTPGSTNNQITLEESPVLISPAENTTGVDTSVAFNYSSVTSPGVIVVSFRAGDRGFHVVQNSNSTRIPDFSSFGIPLGQSVNYAWFITKYNNIPTVDSFVSTWLDNNDNTNSAMTTQTWHFTTAP